MNGPLSSRLNRTASAGYANQPQAYATYGAPTMQGGLQISGQAGTNGAGGVAGVILLALAGLGVFYFATRSIQGFR